MLVLQKNLKTKYFAKYGSNCVWMFDSNKTQDWYSGTQNQIAIFGICYSD